MIAPTKMWRQSRANNMSAANNNGAASDCHGQELLENVFLRFTELLMAAGATVTMIRQASTRALASAVETKSEAVFTNLGTVLRDCMEVMCTWRRQATLVDSQGEPAALELDSGQTSFAGLCSKAGCQHNWQEILKALLDFGAVAHDEDGRVVSRTPTFLLTYASAGGRLATDGLLKQVEGFLWTLHRNVRSVSGQGSARFERACTVSVARELEPVFDRLVRARGQEFVDSIDEWLERNAREQSASGQYVELGAGAYFIDLGPPAARNRI
ncbi:MAG: hypothetical protein ACT4UP_02390 [Gammaproteobacteria bacterium]